MGLKVFQIVQGRDTLEVECDDPAHGDEIKTAWFDCGSHSDNLTLAIAAGWGERRNNRTSVWLCPSCVAALEAEATARCGTYSSITSSGRAHCHHTRGSQAICSYLRAQWPEGTRLASNGMCRNPGR
jgi:hypothetical protein